jgi:predicted DNA-binding protein with PD1-like motif
MRLLHCVSAHDARCLALIWCLHVPQQSVHAIIIEIAGLCTAEAAVKRHSNSMSTTQYQWQRLAEQTEIVSCISTIVTTQYQIV